MFGEVWRWAGTFRRTERNIGIDAYRITTEVESLLSDVRWWVDHATFPDDEIATRLHHSLTVIHPFPNGNGRHARLMADLLIEQRGGPPFSWGSADLVAIGDVRARYVAALRAADRHDLVPLLEFVRS
jgi:Fic-DOC domain mobile mystery protein B